MINTVNHAPTYTWQTAKGELSLYQTGEGYSLQLLTKEHQIVKISKQDIYESFFDRPLEKISEICQHYLPIVKTESNAQSFSVTFHLSTCPTDQPAEDCSPQGSVNKGMDFGFSFNKLESVFFVKFSPNAPSYRTVVRGLNLEGTCQEKTCNAYKKNVFIPVGIGNFNIPQEMSRSVCPACNTTLDFEKITNLGFWNCNYKIDGKQKDVADLISKEDTAPSDKYKTFTPGENCQWIYLGVTTTKIVKN